MNWRALGWPRSNHEPLKVSVVALFDYVSVLIFAATGALVASRAQLDLVGFVFIACLTALGGGTIRDVLLDRNPVFWIGDPTYLAVASGAALVIFFTAHLLESRLRAIVWLDSFALAIAVAAGAGVALSLDQKAVIVILMGLHGRVDAGWGRRRSSIGSKARRALRHRCLHRCGDGCNRGQFCC